MDDVLKVKVDEIYLMKHRGPLLTDDVQEKILNDAGCSAIWDDPQSGDRVFTVNTMPEDLPVFGIKWIVL